MPSASLERRSAGRSATTPSPLSGARVARLLRRLIVVLAALVAASVATFGAAPTSAATPAYTYDIATYAYDAPAGLSTSRASVGAARGSPAVPGAAARVSLVSIRSHGVAANTAEASGSGVLARLRGLDWADDTGAVRVPGSGSRLTTSQATQMAERVGYRPTSFISSGERVFTNGKTFITQDRTAHNGGLWKMANSVQDLRAGARLGTYDYDLNWIAP